MTPLETWHLSAGGYNIFASVGILKMDAPRAAAPVKKPDRIRPIVGTRNGRCSKTWQ
jgi:hypothetical protein